MTEIVLQKLEIFYEKKSCSLKITGTILQNIFASSLHLFSMTFGKETFLRDLFAQ